jgi:hypothetical protein
MSLRRVRRQRAVDNAVHSFAMEGMTVTDEDFAAAASYVDGRRPATSV